jgi:hypothetical protein
MSNVLESLQLSELSDRAIAVLNRETEVLTRLIAARSFAPLPPGYTPKVVEVLYDDLVFIRLEDGYLRYLRPCDQSYLPPFMEMRFDDEIALFMVGTETVINRLTAMATLDEILGVLNSERN